VKSEAGKALMRAEYRRFAAQLEQLSGRKLETAKLQAAVATVNAKRAALSAWRLFRRADPVPISGLDSLLISQISSMTIRLVSRMRSTVLSGT